MFVERLPYLAMGSLGNFIDFLTQNSPGISHQAKQEILASLNLARRLDVFLSSLSILSDQEPKQELVYKDINSKVNAETKKEEKIYRLRKIINEVQKELEKLEGSSE